MSCDIVLITTTINVPDVLRIYNRGCIGNNLRIIIAGDNKSPDDKIRQLCRELGNAVYLDVVDQKALGHECSELIGWDCIMRRNIALLEAIRLKPDLIVTVDDDNFPVHPFEYFQAFCRILSDEFTGLAVQGAGGWFNIGDFFHPPVGHRGFPYQTLPHGYTAGGVIDARVGVVAGLWYGDPDIGAAERIVKAPLITQMSELLRTGLLVTPNSYAPFNSQNTAYRASLAPLMAVPPAIGRFDDIWGSYIAERIMRELGEHLVYGPPFVWQERNEHNLLSDLRNELYGMVYTLQFCNDLNQMELGSGSPLGLLTRLWEQAQGLDYLPQRFRDFGLAWCRDLERIL